MREMQANLFAVLILNDRLNLMFHYKVWYTKSLDGANYTWQVWYSSLSECSIQTISSKGTCIRNTEHQPARIHNANANLRKRIEAISHVFVQCITDDRLPK